MPAQDASSGENKARDTNQSSAPNAEKKHWNSLEISKLVVGLATPVSVGLLAAFVTFSNAEADRAFRTDQATAEAGRLAAASAAENIRTRETAIRAAERELGVQKANEALQRDLADRAAGREQALRDRADARDAKVRRDADIREAGIRAEGAERARLNKVIDKRVELWGQMGPRLNDIFAYMLRVGDWKDLDANRVIELKRDIDRNYYSFLPYFTDEWSSAYQEFMSAAFLTNQGMGTDAKIRARFGCRPKDSDPSKFAAPTPAISLLNSYQRLLSVTSADLGVNARPVALDISYLELREQSESC